MNRHIIHKNYHSNLTLTEDECKDLYSSFKDYGRYQILDAAYNMYTRDETPLHKNWDDDADFMLCFTTIYKLSTTLSCEEFCAFISGTSMSLPDIFDNYENELLDDKKRLQEQACLLLGFLDTIADYFEYEIILMTLGYPCEHYDKKTA